MNDKLILYIEACCKGDATAFEPIVAEYQQLVYTLAFRLLCNEEDAKDATQETFIKVWQNMFRYKRTFKFSTWIYTIASNICYDKLRSERKVSKVSVDDQELYATDDQENSLNNKDLIGLITRVTENLTPKQKLVFTLSEIEGLEVEEIAVITGLTPAKIKSNLYLARKYVKSKIQGYER